MKRKNQNAKDSNHTKLTESTFSIHVAMKFFTIFDTSRF